MLYQTIITTLRDCKERLHRGFRGQKWSYISHARGKKEIIEEDDLSFKIRAQTWEKDLKAFIKYMEGAL